MPDFLPEVPARRHPLEYLLVYTSRLHIAQVALELTKLSGAIKQIDFAVIIKNKEAS